MNYLPVGRTLSVTFGMLLMAASVLAASHKANELRTRYQQELAVCQSGKSGQEVHVCQREAEAAFAAAKRGDLDNGLATYTRNAQERCIALPTTQRAECMKRMQGQGTVDGSVAGGGILRELVVPQTAASAAASTAKN